jgi:hypothetical protein
MASTAGIELISYCSNGRRRRTDLAAATNIKEEVNGSDEGSGVRSRIQSTSG